MTKIILSPLLLDYREFIADLSSQSSKSRYVAGVDVWECSEPVLAQDHLLPPPQMEAMDLAIYDGHVHDLLLFLVSSVFGISNVHVVITDQHGDLVESGDAFVCMDEPDIWHYFTTASVPSGTSVTVQVIASDRVLGMGIRSEEITIP